MTGTERAEEMQTTCEAVEMHLVQALTRCESDAVSAHLQAALQHCRDLLLTPLVECPVCGRVGLPERIQMHECQAVSRNE